MRGDSQVWKPTAKSHGGPLTAHELGWLNSRLAQPEATNGDEKVTCGTCVGTGYIGTPATRTPVWEQPEEEALATAPKECPECLGEIWDDECQCPVEGIPSTKRTPFEEAEAAGKVAVPTPTDSIVDQLIEDAANDPTAIVSDDVAERVNPAPPEILVDMDLSGMNLPDMPKFVTSNEVEL
jgi:hypothetical protein